MRKISLVIVLCVCIGACAPKPDYITSEKITVGVLYFERNSVVEELEPYRAALADMFITELQKIPQLQVVLRSRLDAIMSELELSELGVIDPETAQKIGRLMGAQTIYQGSFTYIPPYDKRIRLDGHLVRVETGEVEAAGEDTCKIDDKDIIRMVNRQSKIIAAKIKANHRELVADGFYSKGRTAEDENDKDSAIRYYQRALEYYPKHELSRKRLERLQY
jgi:TolB-like protein